MSEVFVNMGEISSAKSQGILTTVGLGSCIGVTLYDERAKVGSDGPYLPPPAVDRMIVERRLGNTPIRAFLP